MSLKSFILGKVIKAKLGTALAQFKNVKASETQAAIAAVLLKVGCLTPACPFIVQAADLIGFTPDELVRFLVYYIGTRFSYKFVRAKEAIPLGPPTLD